MCLSTKKTLTRWTPDWESAGRFYRDAVKLYKLAGEDERTIQACRESAVCHDELGQFLTTAADLETAASLLAKEGSEAKRRAAFDCYRESGLNYRKNNSYEKAAAMYVKAAEVMEAADDRALALEALQEACSIFEDEQRGQFHDSTFKLAIGKAVKWGRYDAAIAFMRRQTALVKEQQLLSTFATDVHKNRLQTMVLLYQQGDVQAAREEFEQAEAAAGERFPQSDQYPAAAALVDAYDSGDSEKLGEALKLTPFKYIMNSIAVIARKLQMTEGRQRRSRKTPDTAAHDAAAAADEDEKDEDDFT